ncbi:MAG: hypothetical protein HY833_03125 [Candidatus Aenigmarchaeota archaeon]|nr:hypothetical protein [Candidatus Aenigmarchaeota archaeon]
MPEFKCDHCEKVFEHTVALQQHVRDKHLQPQPEAATAVPAAQPPHQEKKPENRAHHPGGKVKIKINNTVLYAVIAVLVVGAGGYGAYAYMSSQPAPPSQDSAVPATGAPLGQLGSTHIHADFQIYLDGDQITPLERRYYVRGPYMHVETGPGEGVVIHMHATNSPLSIFFRSLGMSLNSECFRLDNGKDYCNSGTKTLKMFVKKEFGDWEENRQFHTYIFQNHDRILITYGDETAEELQAQKDSVTEFSRDNDDGQMDLSRIPR